VTYRPRRQAQESSPQSWEIRHLNGWMYRKANARLKFS
jgi:hypothetical protein